MTFQPAINCAKAVIKHAVGSNNFYNILNFYHGTSYGQVNITDLAEAIDSWWATEMMPLFDADYLYVETTVTGLTSENDLTATVDTGAGGGAVVGQLMPYNVAFVITHRTGYTGRSARGRTYHSGLSDVMFAATNQLTQTVVDDIEAAWAELDTYLAATSWEFVVLSRFHNGSKRATATFFPVISSTARNTVVDSQRGRLPERH